MSAFVSEGADPRARRYSTKVLAYARELKAAGWTAHQITVLIADRHGIEATPAINTVRRWTEPGFVRTRRASALPAQRRWREKTGR